jgi:hypothetical protein
VEADEPAARAVQGERRDGIHGPWVGRDRGDRVVDLTRRERHLLPLFPAAHRAESIGAMIGKVLGGHEGERSSPSRNLSARQFGHLDPEERTERPPKGDHDVADHLGGQDGLYDLAEEHAEKGVPPVEPGKTVRGLN